LRTWKLAPPPWQCTTSLVSTGTGISKNGIIVFPKPLYSQEPAHADYYQFPRMKALLKGYKLQSAEEVKEAITIAFMDVTRKGLQECFQQ
jgi:hypothetical protein